MGFTFAVRSPKGRSALVWCCRTTPPIMVWLGYDGQGTNLVSPYILLASSLAAYFCMSWVIISILIETRVTLDVAYHLRQLIILIG